MAALAHHRTVGGLVFGGDVAAHGSEGALDAPAVQRAFHGQCAPCVLTKEVWTPLSTDVEVSSLHRWLKANNAGRRTGNMMLAAGHADPRGRAPEARMGARMVIDCDLAPTMCARWAIEAPL